MKLKLPQLMYFGDYHEINFLEDQLKKIIPGIKSKELGCIGYRSGAYYVGIFYLKQDKAYSKLLKEYKTIEKSYDQY